MILTLSQRTPEWYAARIGRITASLAAAVLGLDPYVGRFAAYRKIMGETGDSTNRHMQWGVQFEDDARRDYENATGNLVYETGFWVHDDFPWLGASPDGLIGKDGGVEIKCPSEVPAEIPVAHKIQMHINMFVTGRLWWDYYAWAMSSTFTKRLHRLPNYTGMVSRLQDFYDKHLATQTPPKITRRRKRKP